MRVAIFVRAERDDPTAPQLSRSTAATIEALRTSDDDVDVVVPEACVWRLDDLRPRHDLYVLKSKSPLALGLASALTALGATVVNSVASTRLAKDKIAHTPLLAAAGVPLPPSWAVASCTALRRLADEQGDATLWLKPPAGGMASGVRRCRGAAEVGNEEPTEPLLAQVEAPGGGGDDLKLYVVGDWVGAVRRPPPGTADDLSKLARPVELTPRLRELGLAVGRALGLELYGVDLLGEADDLTVIDVNAYPGYGGLPEAPARIAAHLHGRAASGRAASGV